MLPRNETYMISLHSNFQNITQSLPLQANKTIPSLQKAFYKTFLNSTPAFKILIQACQKTHPWRRPMNPWFFHANLQKIGKWKENTSARCANRFQLPCSMNFTGKLTPTSHPWSEIHQNWTWSWTTLQKTLNF